MESEQEFRRIRQVALGIFIPAVVAIGSLVVLSFLYGRPFPLGYTPFFFGWWIFIPLFFFGFFFFSRGWWGWGWWGQGSYYQDPALETLRQRFARGEITKEQYEQMRKDLEGK